MDKRSPGKDGPEEVTRESLISIAYTEPEQVLSAKPSSGISNLDSTSKVIPPDGADSDGDDKFRSELIAISYELSPDDDLPRPQAV